MLQQKDKVLVESLETYITGPRIYTKNHINIPGRTLAVLNVTADIKKEHWNTNFNVQANRLLINEYPNLIAIPTIHCKECTVPNHTICLGQFIHRISIFTNKRTLRTFNSYR